MWLTIAKNVGTSISITLVSAILIVLILKQFAYVEIHISGAALILGIAGSSLAFMGNSLVADALGRYDAHGLPQWRWGNRLQSVGFGMTITALIVA